MPPQFIDESAQLERLHSRFPCFVRVFREKRHWTLRDYSASLWTDPRSSNIETALERAWLRLCREECRNETDAYLLLRRLRQFPILQTAHHLTPTNGPGFTFLDILALVGKPKERLYLVAANSGVACSNTAWSGALSFSRANPEQLLNPAGNAFKRFLRGQQNRESDGASEKRISLIPSRWRDALLYSLDTRPIESKEDDFSDSLRALFPSMKHYQRYASWCAAACQELQRAIFKTNDIYYCDVNRWITFYIEEILEEQEHPLQKILFDPKTRARVTEFFDESDSFLTQAVVRNKSSKVRRVSYRRFCQEFNRETFMEELTGGRLTAGTFLLFFVLCALNGIRCFGSYLQSEYLPRYCRIWQELGDILEADLYFDPRLNAMSIGAADETSTLYSLDMYMSGERIDLNRYATFPMSRFWRPVIRKLNASAFLTQ